eukprot:834888-Amphidinium_carterae.4
MEKKLQELWLATAVATKCALMDLWLSSDSIASIGQFQLQIQISRETFAEPNLPRIVITERERGVCCLTVSHSVFTT